MQNAMSDGERANERERGCTWFVARERATGNGFFYLSLIAFSEDDGVESGCKITIFVNILFPLRSNSASLSLSLSLSPMERTSRTSPVGKGNLVHGNRAAITTQ